MQKNWTYSWRAYERKSTIVVGNILSYALSFISRMVTPVWGSAKATVSIALIYVLPSNHSSKDFIRTVFKGRFVVPNGSLCVTRKVFQMSFSSIFISSSSSLEGG